MRIQQNEPSATVPATQPDASVWALAFCWKDEPYPVNAPPEAQALAHRFEALCRRESVVCLLDGLPLPPSRGVRSLLRPIPRLQTLATSVWRDASALRMLDAPGGDSGRHGAALRTELSPRDHVLFWIPRAAIPTVAQAEQGLSRLQVTGPGAILGNLERLPEDPPALPMEFEHPAAEAIHRHRLRVAREPAYAALQYDRRAFQAQGNTANGDVRRGLRFDYHEQNGMVWAWYEGDGVFLGSLVATKSADGALRMAYRHLNAADLLRAGQCLSFPEFLPDGRLRMHEYWRWTTADESAGESVIEEVAGITVPRKLS